MFSAAVGVRIAGSSTVAVRPGRQRWYADGAYALSAIIVVSAGFIGYDVRTLLRPNLDFVRGYLQTVLTTATLPPVDPFDAKASNLSSLCPPNSNVLVWGWSAVLYSYYNWQPASRYDDSYWQIEDYGDPSYYRGILLDELKTDPPACIVEAIGGYFYGHDSADRHRRARRPWREHPFEFLLQPHRHERGHVVPRGGLCPTTDVCLTGPRRTRPRLDLSTASGRTRPACSHEVRQGRPRRHARRSRPPPSRCRRRAR